MAQPTPPPTRPARSVLRCGGGGGGAAAAAAQEADGLGEGDLGDGQQLSGPQHLQGRGWHSRGRAHGQVSGRLGRRQGGYPRGYPPWGGGQVVGVPLGGMSGMRVGIPLGGICQGTSVGTSGHTLGGMSVGLLWGVSVPV